MSILQIRKQNKRSNHVQFTSCNTNGTIETIQKVVSTRQGLCSRTKLGWSVFYNSYTTRFCCISGKTTRLKWRIKATFEYKNTFKKITIYPQIYFLWFIITVLMICFRNFVSQEPNSPHKCPGKNHYYYQLTIFDGSRGKEGAHMETLKFPWATPVVHDNRWLKAQEWISSSRVWCNQDGGEFLEQSCSVGFRGSSGWWSCQYSALQW